MTKFGFSFIPFWWLSHKNEYVRGDIPLGGAAGMTKWPYEWAFAMLLLAHLAGEMVFMVFPDQFSDAQVGNTDETLRRDAQVETTDDMLRICLRPSAWMQKKSCPQHFSNFIFGG